MTIVAKAFKEGSIPGRSILQITIGSVLCAPILKYVMTNMLKDREKMSSIAPTMVGRMRGKITILKALNGVAPKS